MVKTNLPVILLKGLVLLPYQEVRIEINNRGVNYGRGYTQHT